MITVCEICGDVGYEYLLVSCNDCKGAAAHQYCLDEVVFDGSLVDWLCYECQQRRSEVTYERSLQKVPNKRQPSTASLKSTKESEPRRNHKNKSYKTKSTSLKRICSTRMNSLARKHRRKKSNMRPMGNKTNRREHNATNNACTSGKAFHSRAAITMETAKASNGENQQVDNKYSVHMLNNDHVANGLPPRVKQTNLQKPLDGSESPSKIAEKLNLPKEQGGSYCSLQDVQQPTPSPLIEDRLSDPLGSTKQSHILKAIEGLAHKSSNATQSLTKPIRGFVMKTKNVDVLKSSKDGLGSRSKNIESSNPKNERANSVLEKKNGDKSKCLKDREIVTPILDNSEESNPFRVKECSVTSEDSSKLENKRSDELLRSDKYEERQGEVIIASFGNASFSEVHFTHHYPSKQYYSLKAKGSSNPRSALEDNQTGQSNLQSNVGKLPFSIGKVTPRQVSPAEDYRSASLSSKHIDHGKSKGMNIEMRDDNQLNPHAPLGCENMKVKFVKDNETVVGAQSRKYWVDESLKNLDKPETHCDSDDHVIDDFTLERDKKKARFQLDDKASNDLLRMAASVPQPSALHKNAVNRAMSSSANMAVLPKESNCVPSEHIDIENPKGSYVTPVLTGGNQSEPSRLLDQAFSSSFSETSSKANIVLKASAVEVELSDTVQNFVKDNRRKQRRLILPDNDDDEVEEAADVQPEDSNPRSLECDGSMKKNKIDTEDYVEAVQTGDLNGQDLKNGRPVKQQECVQDGEHAVQLDILISQSSEITCPVKKRRRYIEANGDEEDEEIITGVENAECVLNDVAKLASQTVVAKDHLLQSRTAFDSESANQQCYIYSQPIDVPVWSGIFKINNEVFVALAAHLSTKACQRVWELSKLLQPTVEVMKLPRLEAWPKSWKTSGPTDDSIGLFFFPHSTRPNGESDRLVEEVIDSDAVLKIVVGIAELLIFPSTLLTEQYHVFQGKHYLWGVFKRREDTSDKVLTKKQDGSACATEEGEVHEHNFLEQQSEVHCESSDQETFVVKHVVHVENQLLAEHNREVQKDAMKVAMREGLDSPGSSSSSAKPLSPKAGSNCFLQPRIGRKLHAAEKVDQQEDEQDFTSSPQWDVSNTTKPSSDSGPAAVTPKLINSAEHGHGQPHCGVVPPTTTLFGFVTALTPSSQQLIQQMASEGALLFSVPEEMVTSGSTIGNRTGVELELTPDNADNEYPHMQERRQSIEFVPMDHDDPDVASEACLELFPVRQEQIGSTQVEVSKQVDLDLSLSVRSRAPSASL